MRTIKLKIIVFVMIIISFLFFSNNFETVDIEKTAIITAIAIDIEDGVYKATAQIAVPEATNANTENSKAEVYGKGLTVGDAIKDIGDSSGWYPQLTFCNLIILGNSVKQINCMKIIDYFSTTLRIQDSAVLVLAEKKAEELLQISTPLDHISSFAIQKILLKNPGFDNDTAENDIKDFSVGYYSKASSSFMPIVKAIKVSQPSDEGGGGSSSSGSSSGGGTESGSQSGQDGKGKHLFDSRSTALFKDGKYVGELTPDQTLAFNVLSNNVDGTTFELKDVVVNSDGGEYNGNYLLTALSKKAKMKVICTPSKVVLDIKIDAFVKVSSQDSEKSNQTVSFNTPIDKEILLKAEQKLSNLINELVQVETQTECDFLGVLNKIYQRNHKYYDLYKDNFYNKIQPKISVNVYGQK